MCSIFGKDVLTIVMKNDKIYKLSDRSLRKAVEKNLKNIFKNLLTSGTKSDIIDRLLKSSGSLRKLVKKKSKKFEKSA